MQRFACARQLLFPALAAIGLALAVIGMARAQGGEALHKPPLQQLGEGIRDLGRKVGNDLAILPLEGLPSASATTIVIDGKPHEDKGLNPSTAEILSRACGKSRQDLCSDKMMKKAVPSYEAAARALGIPAAVLICLTKEETGFHFGRKSDVGAKGINQFMPATAAFFESVMVQGFGPYAQAWKNYAALGGTDNPKRSEFNAENITSADPEDVDVQIFAAAMYFRYYLNDTESHWRKHAGDTTHLYRYLFASYNGGPGRGQTYINDGYGVDRLPRETRAYLPDTDSCMAGARLNSH